MLKIIRAHMKPEQRIFVGVTDPINPRIETPEEIRDRILRGGRTYSARPAGHHRRLRFFSFLR